MKGRRLRMIYLNTVVENINDPFTWQHYSNQIHYWQRIEMAGSAFLVTIFLLKKLNFGAS